MKAIHILGMGMSVLAVSAASISQAASKDAVERQIRGLNDRLSAYENRFRVNGFATLGVTQSDEEIGYNGYGVDNTGPINNETNFRRYTKAGVQMTFNIDRETSVVTQMVSRGSTDFETKMEWAYFKHNFTPELSGKLGKIRGPYFMLSEYLDVGYAVPWTSMPSETYEVMSIFANLEGADLTWETSFSDLIAQTQFVYGRIEGETYDGDDVISLGFTLSGDTWSVRVGHSQASIVTDDPTISQLSATLGDDNPIDGSFQGIGFRWEPGNLLVMGEYTTFSTPNNILMDEDTFYLTTGYRIGQWMPHITYAQVESTDDDDRDLDRLASLTGYGTGATMVAAASTAEADIAAATAALIAAGGDTTDATYLAAAAQAQVSGTAAGLVSQQALNSNTQRIGLGVRYDFTSGVAMKLQYDMITVDDAAGLFDGDAFVAAGGDAPDSTNIITFTIDTVF
jgi:opacity protein-like surface antigen